MIRTEEHPGKRLPGDRPSLIAVRQLLALASALALVNCPAQAAVKPSARSVPTGTLLIPIAPKIDTSGGAPDKPAQHSSGKAPATAPPGNHAKTKMPQAAPAGEAPPAATTPGPTGPSCYAPQLSDDVILKPAPETISPEQGDLDGEPGEIGEDTTLKGTIQMVADDTEYDQEKNTFLGTGNAVVIIAGEDSKLEADTILYDQNNQVIDARGNVRIIRSGQLTTGSAFRFKVTSNEYLITNPDTEVQGTTVIARKGFGNKSGLAFQDGTLQLAQPIHMANNVMYGPMSAADEISEKATHPEAYLPEKPSFKFKARKMTFERYKQEGNLTIFGGRIMFGRFGIPVPKFVATVGQENNRVVFPVTPVVGNNLQMGGISVGPSINRPIGKTGVFAVAPLLQIGGRNWQTGTSNSGKLGVGARIGYTNDYLQTHLAYGSVSNLMVADFILKVSQSVKYQFGVNRFLDDGMFGMRRARVMSEVVHTRSIGRIPFIAALTFRTSAGAAQDDSALLNLTPEYKELFNAPQTPDKKFALRVQEQITAITHPILSVGNDQLGAKAFIYGGVALRGYSTGDGMIMGQVGPILNVYLKRIRLQGGYTQSGVRGQSPFVFDQFIQGQRSINLGGDVKISKYLTVGASTGYNLNAKLLYQRSITAAVGPDDFKVLFSYDTIRRTNRYGFDLLFGQPIPFNKLVLKGAADHGQLGGI